jgi:hypothetical protein
VTTQRWPWEGAAHLDGEPLPKISPTEVKRVMRAIATILLAAFAEEETPVVKKRKTKKRAKKFAVKAKRSTRKKKRKVKP